MENNKRQGSSYAVEIPKGKEDPSWLRIGGIAIVCFGIGVAWPKITGVRVGPNAPAEATAARAAASAESAGPVASAAPAASAASKAPSAALSAPAPGAAAAPNAPGVPGPDVLVKNGILLSCKTEAGESVKGLSCGPIAFDGIAQPRIKKLSQCAAAQGAEGKLGVVFTLDFRSNKTIFDVSRSSNVKDPDGLVACLKQGFESVSLSAIRHEHPSYSLLYNASFSPPRVARDPVGPPQGAVRPTANGEVPIMWEVAIVRDKPRTGQVVARLPRGTNVRLGSGQDGGWYQVQYGDAFGSEGWLYRAAIGK